VPSSVSMASKDSWAKAVEFIGGRYPWLSHVGFRVGAAYGISQPYSAVDNSKVLGAVRTVSGQSKADS
jgi:hypothetical protein